MRRLTLILSGLALTAACGVKPPKVKSSRGAAGPADVAQDGNGDDDAVTESRGIPVGKLNFKDHILPIMKQHCVSCHSSAAPLAKLALEVFEDKLAGDGEAAKWRRVLTAIDAKAMPPGSNNPVHPDDVETIRRWIDAGFDDDPVVEPEACKVSSAIGRTTIQRLSKTEFENTLAQLFALDLPLSQAIPIDTSSPDGFDNNADFLSMQPEKFSTYYDVTRTIITQALAREGNPITNCEGNPQDAVCAKRKIEWHSLRAFRRPPTTDEVDKLLGIFNTSRGAGVSFSQSLAAALQAVYLSPSTLYRTFGVDSNGAATALLSDYELAARLAAFLWNSPPDNTLLDLASRDELGNDAALRAQVKRMLADPKAALFGESFTGQWLGTRRILSTAYVSRSADLFPEFTDDLRLSMKRETDSFFYELLKSDGSMLDLLDGEYTYVNGTLASLYGVAGVTGEAFQKISTVNLHRKGVLTHAGIMTMLSKPHESAPTGRGNWILNEITCTPPPPFPDAMPIPKLPESTAGLSARELMAVHRQSPVCAGCHAKMDPVGLAFEHFGPIGQYRTADSKGNAIDASGTLPDGQTFADHNELVAILAAEKDFQRCVTKKLMTYALGRGMRQEDKCAVEGIADANVGRDKKVSDLIEAIVTSDYFRTQQN